MRIGLLSSLLLLGYFSLTKSSNDKKAVRGTQFREFLSKHEPTCSVTLPQKATRKCQRLRQEELEAQRSIYQLVPHPPLPMLTVNMTIPQLVAQYSQDTFLKEHLENYLATLRGIGAFSEQWIKQHPSEIHDFQGYKNIFKEFRTQLANNGSTGFNRLVSNVEPFRDILEDWRDDDMFAEQRLSGINPLVIRRVTDDSSDVGLKWSELRKTLNLNYNWEAAIQRASGNDDPLEKAINSGVVYVLRYEEFDNMISYPDTEDRNPGRIVWPTKSPIALFVMRTKDQDKRFRPAAIQIDHKPDSPVFSPVDGDSWMLAKMVVQATDYVHSQIIEHRLKTHYFAEPFCVVLYRQISSKHPLNELLKYHCRGLIPTITLGNALLFAPNGVVDELIPSGPAGAMLLIAREYQTMEWNNADFNFDIKKRGLDDKKMLPYFPYRDDSELLLTAIKGMVKDYVNIYYPRDRHVRKDEELKSFVRELTTKRPLPGGGYGPLVKGFPAKLNTKNEVIDMMAKLIWLMSVKHAAVNFPMTDYGAFTPLMPTKVYNDTRVPPGEFAVYNLPNGNISSTQVRAAMAVGLYHYDTLFDYYKQLSNPLASRVVGYYYYHLRYIITEKLKERNDKRLKSGHLTYPYLQYPWVPNGVST